MPHGWKSNATAHMHCFSEPNHFFIDNIFEVSILSVVYSLQFRDLHISKELIDGMVVYLCWTKGLL